MNDHYINEIKKEYRDYMNKRIRNYAFKAFHFLAVMALSALSFYFIFRKPAEDKSKCDEDKARYIVVAYNNKGNIHQTLFCSEARKNEDKKEVVCTVAATGETYILSYPVSIKDVTYTIDYLKYVNEK